LGSAVPVPEAVLTRAFRWSIEGRYFDDAERIQARVARMSGSERLAESMAAQLATAKAAPLSPLFIPLAFAGTRPSAATARRLGLLGTWRGVIERQPPQVSSDLELEFVASGDTVIMRTRSQVPGSGLREGTLPIIQFTSEGVLEWAFPLRGLPGVEAYSGRLVGGDRLEGGLEFRGIVVPGGRDPRDPTTRFRFQRVAAPAP
jgi:hypothetical protein